MTIRNLFITLLIMATSQMPAFESSYEVELQPDAAKRRTVTIFRLQGPKTARLYLHAPEPWVIANSRIIAQDDTLWSGFNTSPNSRSHIYRMVNAHSSQQYVSIYGFLTQLGPGHGRNPWFRATVPAVDIDWEKHSGAGHENDEDTWVGLCPITTNQNERAKVIVRKLKDDRSLVTPSMTLECWSTTAVRFLKQDGVSMLWNGATISDSETPLTLHVDPQHAGPFEVTLLGPSDDNFNRPQDYLTGMAVEVDLDVDANNNGIITKEDDPLEENPGGILATGAVKQVNLRLEPFGLTGKLELSAVSGGGRIRVWREPGKVTPVALPAEWSLAAGGNTFPNVLYVEGLTASSAARDVHLRLRYTAANGQYVEDNIRLTVIRVELTKPKVDEKFKFNSSSPGKLEIEFAATVTPDSTETRAFLAGKVKFEKDTIGASVLSWDNPGGIGVYNSGVFKNKATFTGLPKNNSDFGQKKVRMKVTDCSGCDSERTIKTFYTATAANHPGGTTTDPNWFYYYKDEEGGTDYTYDPTLSTSQSTPSVPNSIRIANNAYSGGVYIQTSIVGGQRKASGISSTIKYWKYFSGVVIHERFHVSNGANHGAVLDPDADDLKTSFETGTVSSDPKDKYSIDGGVFGNSVWDDECWAGGPIEKSGIDAADITKDWANPGSQWH